MAWTGDAILHLLPRNTWTTGGHELALVTFVRSYDWWLGEWSLAEYPSPDDWGYKLYYDIEPECHLDIRFTARDVVNFFRHVPFLDNEYYSKPKRYEGLRQRPGPNMSPPPRGPRVELKKPAPKPEPKVHWEPPPLEQFPDRDVHLFDLATHKGFRVNILRGTKDLFQLEPLPKGYKYDRTKQEPAHWGQATFVINPVNDTTVFTLEQAMSWLRSLPETSP